MCKPTSRTRFTVIMVYVYLWTITHGENTATSSKCEEFGEILQGNRGYIHYGTKNESKCLWIIQRPTYANLIITVEEIDIGNVFEANQTCSSPDNDLEISTKPRAHRFELCGRSVEDLQETTFDFRDPGITSVEINFSSTGGQMEKRFKLSYTLSCSHSVSGSAGQITSPNYPGKYPKGIACTTTINGPMNTEIHIYFSEMEIRSNDSRCEEDYVEVDSYEKNLGRFCSKRLPAGKIITESNEATLEFVSTAFQDGGFVADWTAVAIPEEEDNDKDPMDFTWLVMVIFATALLLAVCFVVCWLRKKPDALAFTPESQASGSHSVFKFDKVAEKHRYIKSGVDRLRRLSPEDRKMMTNKWIIDNSVIAKKRAASKQQARLSQLAPKMADIPEQRSAERDHWSTPTSRKTPISTHENDTLFPFDSLRLYSSQTELSIHSPYLSPTSPGFPSRYSPMFRDIDKVREGKVFRSPLYSNNTSAKEASGQPLPL